MPMTLDDDEIEIVLLALKIATQECGEAMSGTRRNGPAHKCIAFCLPKFAAMCARIEQHQQDQEEEKNARAPIV